MKRDHFVGLYIKLIVDQSNRWLPEESTTEFMFDVLTERINQHSGSIIKEFDKEDQ